MFILGYVLLAIVGAGVTALALSIVWFNIKRKRIMRAAARATPAELETIYALVEASGSADSTGFVLGRTNTTADDPSCVVEIPATMTDFPWAGRSFHVEAAQDVQFRASETTGSGIRLLGRVYRPVAVPREKLASGKERNRFNPRLYVRSSSILRDSLVRICPEHPEDLLSYLLCAGQDSFEFEPINQARIGTSAAWIQDPEFQYCDQCRKRMILVLQIPGTLVHRKAFHSATFYLLGCKSHPDRTASVKQYS
jgi:hypothetical protein